MANNAMDWTYDFDTDSYRRKDGVVITSQQLRQRFGPPRKIDGIECGWPIECCALLADAQRVCK